MKSVRLAVRLTGSFRHPMHEFVCESAAVDREVLLEGKVEDGVRTLLFYVEGDRDAYERALADRMDPDEYDSTAESETGFYLYIRGPNRTAEAEIFGAFDRETVVVASPVEYRSDGTMRLTLVGPSADLQAVLDSLPSDLAVDVRSVGEYRGGGTGSLTARQREALETAWERGYYAVPREGDITEVAAALECATSTASTLLRRAERQLVASRLDEPVPRQ